MEGLLQSRSTARILLLVSVFIYLFYAATAVINDVYEYKLVGALFELLWLPTLLLLIIVPVLCIIHLVNRKSGGKRYSLFSLLLITLAFVFLTL
jgi:cytochrome bd-type quinol oxidase subunit 2